MSWGGKRKGAGRKLSSPPLKKVAYNTKLPKWLKDWLTDPSMEKEASGPVMIERALCKIYKLRPPDDGESRRAVRRAQRVRTSDGLAVETTMELTREKLIDAIRGANSLEELKRMVGPSAEESEAARQRIRALDDIVEHMDKHALNVQQLPWHLKEQWGRLMKQQGEFENMYC